MDDFTSPIMVAIYLTIALLAVTVFFAVVLPQIPTRSVWNMFLGVQAPPIFVAFVRRVVVALATLVITAVAVKLGLDGTFDVAGVAGSVWAIAELSWGMLDQKKKKDQNAINPPAIAGGAKPEDVGPIP